MSEESKEISEETEKITKITAKAISKFFKFMCTSGTVVCAVLKWVGVMPNATILEICLVWAFVYGLGAGTIDINIILDKFVGARRD